MPYLFPGEARSKALSQEGTKHWPGRNSKYLKKLLGLLVGLITHFSHVVSQKKNLICHPRTVCKLMPKEPLRKCHSSHGITSRKSRDNICGDVATLLMNSCYKIYMYPIIFGIIYHISYVSFESCFAKCKACSLTPDPYGELRTMLQTDRAVIVTLLLARTSHFRSLDDLSDLPTCQSSISAINRRPL